MIVTLFQVETFAKVNDFRNFKSAKRETICD